MGLKMTKTFKFVIRDRETGDYFFANRKPNSPFFNRYDKYSMQLMFGDIIGYQNCADKYTASECTVLLLKKFKQDLRQAKKELKECIATDPATIHNKHSFNYYVSVRERMVAENTVLVKKWTDIAKAVKASPQYIVELLSK
jgi:hypothetical protein